MLRSGRTGIFFRRVSGCGVGGGGAAALAAPAAQATSAALQISPPKKCHES